MSEFQSVAIADVQKYWDERPCNVRHSPRSIGSREYFEEVEARKYLVEPHIPEFASFDSWKDKKVLELGCGIGTDTIRFARAGAQVTAVDLSEQSLALARRRAEIYGISDRIRFYQANGEELSQVVPVETYDLAYSFGVVHHTPHPDRAVAELRKYLAPGSTLKLMVYHRYAWKVLWIALRFGRGQFWKLSELIARHSEAQTGCPVTYAYSRTQARSLVEAQGFRVQDIGVDHIFPYRIPDYLEYRYVRNWYWRWMPDRFFRALERRFGWHLCITAKAV